MLKLHPTTRERSSAATTCLDSQVARNNNKIIFFRIANAFYSSACVAINKKLKIINIKITN